MCYQGRMMSACGKPKALVTRRLAGAFDPSLKTKASDEAVMQRLKEAAECLKRALLGADPREITIHSKLAKLHEELDEPTEAAAYHRRVVEICRIEGPYLSPNLFRQGHLSPAERPVQDYAKSSIYVARHHMVVPGGDLLLAKDYLERVASSNAEEVAQASDWLKKLKPVLIAQKTTIPTTGEMSDR